MGFISDFYESSDVVDTMSHSGTAGCNLCSFRIYKGSAKNTFLAAYSANIHSAHSSHRRSAIRNQAVRAKGISEQNCRFMRLTPNVTETSVFPLLKRHKLLRSFETYRNPNKHHFDAFRNNVIAPDHVLIGNIRNLIQALFLSLNSEESQSHLNALIDSNLKQNRLTREGITFNTVTKRLNSTTFNTTFSIWQALLPSIVQLQRI